MHWADSPSSQSGTAALAVACSGSILLNSSHDLHPFADQILMVGGPQPAAEE